MHWKVAGLCHSDEHLVTGDMVPPPEAAMTRLAPASAAPWTALIPIPPMPTTTTVSPGRTSARTVAEPKPVATPQLTSATTSSGRSSSTFPAVTDMTFGQMADKVIMTPGVLYGEMMQLGTGLAGKGGTIVVTAIAPITQTESSVNLFELAMWNKEIKGTIFGSLNPRHDIPRLLNMYREGQLKLDELITQRYSLDEVNDGYEAMRQGQNIRGVIVHA